MASQLTHDLLEALTWALAELRGQTRYTDDQQRNNCYDRADDAVARAQAEEATLPSALVALADVARPYGVLDLAVVAHANTPHADDVLATAKLVRSTLAAHSAVGSE